MYDSDIMVVKGKNRPPVKASRKGMPDKCCAVRLFQERSWKLKCCLHFSFVGERITRKIEASRVIHLRRICVYLDSDLLPKSRQH